MANNTGATEAYALRMTPRELEIVRETAEHHGCSLNTAIRHLIRRGYDWTPYKRSDGTYEIHPETAPPEGGKLPLYPPQGFYPDVPEGQTAIEMETASE